MDKTEELNTQLFEKMQAEQRKHRDWLLPTLKDFNEDLQALVREPKQEMGCLKSSCLLADCYEVFNKREDSHMDDIYDSVESMAIVLSVRISKSHREKAGVFRKGKV